MNDKWEFKRFGQDFKNYLCKGSENVRENTCISDTLNINAAIQDRVAKKLKKLI